MAMLIQTTKEMQNMLINNEPATNNQSIPIDKGPTVNDEPVIEDPPGPNNRRSFLFDQDIVTHFAADNMTVDPVTGIVTDVLDHITNESHEIIGTPVMEKGGLQTKNGGLQFNYSDSTNHKTTKKRGNNISIFRI